LTMFAHGACMQPLQTSAAFAVVCWQPHRSQHAMLAALHWIMVQGKFVHAAGLYNFNAAASGAMYRGMCIVLWGKGHTGSHRGQEQQRCVAGRCHSPSACFTYCHVAFTSYLTCTCATIRLHRTRSRPCGHDISGPHVQPACQQVHAAHNNMKTCTPSLHLRAAGTLSCSCHRRTACSICNNLPRDNGPIASHPEASNPAPCNRMQTTRHAAQPVCWPLHAQCCATATDTHTISPPVNHPTAAAAPSFGYPVCYQTLSAL
jgi:hypothetical protein